MSNKSIQMATLMSIIVFGVCTFIFQLLDLVLKIK